MNAVSIDHIVKLSKPQLDLIRSKSRFPAFVGGFGSGKTFALVNRMIKLKMRNLNRDIAYYMPTYDHIESTAFPRFEEVLEQYNIPFKSTHGIKPRIKIENGGAIIMRSMDRPARIIAYQVAHSGVDEIDTLKEKDALAAWQKIVARNRQETDDGQTNTIGIATTPEGFRFVYQFWKNKPPSAEYELIKAKTSDNAKHLPENYIQDLLDLYPPQLVEAYLNGEFVNMTSGAVYPNFDRVLNGCFTEIIPGEPLHIGQDFNVGKMASVIFVLRKNEPHAVGELSKVFDTPTTIVMLKQKYANHPMIIYPDASGNARKSNNASQSDIALFNASNMQVFVNNVNPFIKDRVLSVNSMILNSMGERKFKVNIDKCPVLVESLEKQAYDENGEPDKSSDLDHPVDAAGYFIAYRYPVLSGQRQRVEIHGR